MMKEVRGKIDENDLEYVIKRKGVPWAALPAPYSKWEGQTKINPHVSRFFYNDGSITDVFHVKPIYYETADKKQWRPISEIASYYGNKRGIILYPDKWYQASFRWLVWMMKRQELLKGEGIRIGYATTYLKEILGQRTCPLVLNPTDTFFPDPSPTTTSVDGFVRRSNACESFANLRGGTGTTARDNVADDECVIIDVVNGACASPNFFQMHRGFFLFDTSSIPDGDTIDSATFSAQECGAGCTTTDNFSQTIDMVLSTTASNTALAAADFEGTVNNTALQSDTTFTIPNFGTNYNDFPLNATGKSNVSKTGITKFGLKFSGDRTNTAPTWENVIAGQGVKYAETAGTANDPKLAVTHSGAAGGVISNLLLLGIA